MACASCHSDNQVEFPCEIALHFSGLENLHKPHILVFPNVKVCLDCGFSEFSIAEPDLSQLGSVMEGNKSLPAKSAA